MGLFDIFKKSSSSIDTKQELIDKIIKRYFDGSREKLQADVKDFLEITKYEVSFEQMSALLLCSLGYHGTNSSWNQNILNHLRQLCEDKLPEVELKLIFDYCDSHYIHKNPAKEWLLLSELGGRQIGMPAPHEVFSQKNAYPSMHIRETEDEAARRKAAVIKAMAEKEAKKEPPKPIEQELKKGESGSGKIIQIWSLIKFAIEFGPKMQVGKFSDKETGESFHSCIFTKPDGTRTFVAFATKLGELTPSEIAAMKDELQVVKLESGNYSLCKMEKNGWEDVDLETSDNDIYENGKKEPKLQQQEQKKEIEKNCEDYKEKKDHVFSFKLPDGSKYDGEIIKKPFGSIELCGQGEICYINGDKYKGEFKYGRPFGWGKYWFKNGHTHKGYYDEFPKGIGYLNEDYDMFVGNFFMGRLNGWAICYRNHIFKFGYWKEGKLIQDLTNKTLWIRYEISNHRTEYKGNLIQIGKEHEFIRFGIPEKLLAKLMPHIPISQTPKLPAYGFEFFTDGTAKVGCISNYSSGDYMLCKPDGSVEIGKWKENKKISDLSSFNETNPREKYEEDGLDVYKKI